jgi:amino acid adenylation domain-containing protein
MKNDLFITTGMFEDAKEYWMEKFTGELTEVSLLTDEVRTTRYTPATQKIILDKEVIDSLIRISKNDDLSLYVILLTQLKIWLNKITGQEDIVVASSTLKKSSQNFNRFVALRDVVTPGASFKENLIQVKHTVVEGYKHQYYPIRRLIKSLKLSTGFSLFRVMVLLENIHTQEFVKDIRKDFENDILVVFDHTRVGIKGELIYNSELFKPETVKHMMERFCRVLHQTLGNTRILVQDIDLMTAMERKQILETFNNTRKEYPKHSTVHELIQKEAVKKPGKVILTHHHKQLSFQQLDDFTDLLAAQLRNQTQGHQILGIMVEPSIEMMIGVLGILKSGGAYLPIDPDLPVNRICYMLKDCNTQLILTKKGFTEKLEEIQTGMEMELKTIPIEKACQETQTPLLPVEPVQPDDPAYVIYTSGSTGKPKGVMIKHHNIVRLVKNSNFIEFIPQDKLLLTGAIVFDISTFEMWAPLVNGINLSLVDEEIILDGEALGQAVWNQKITILHLIPQLLNQMADEYIEIFEGLSYLMVGGDIVRPGYVNKVRRQYASKGLTIIQMYGPTENTTFSSFFKVDKDYEVKIPIGKPLNNSTIYIVDKHDQIQPIGVPGELCTGGDGLARGYLNNPQLTHEKFVGNPFQEEQLMYRTGDLARWSSDGNIEFLGRKDQQVKIRGFRIELGEIESQLNSHPDIKQAVVVSREMTEKGLQEEIGADIQKQGKDLVLCAYVVADREIPISELRAYLLDYLPEYMVPGYVISLEKIPLTFNGKVDLKALPLPELEDFGQQYTAPRNRVEEKLVEIWSSVLGIEKEKIGIDHNFLRLGGHSLKATILVSRIHKELNVRIPVTEIFKIPTIRGLSVNFEELPHDAFTSLNPVEKKDYYPTSSSQKRLYFLYQLDPYSSVYNISQVFEMKATENQQETREKLGNAFRKLIERHESLRTSFLLKEGEPVQRIHEGISFNIEYTELEDNNGERDHSMEIGEFLRPFQLAQAPLIRIGYIHNPKGNNLLMVDMHHIISDGFSHQILVEDFMNYYQGKPLIELRLQYKDYSEWQNSTSQLETLRHQEQYWIKEFHDTPPVLNVETDFPRPAIQSFNGDSVFFTLEKRHIDSLEKLALERETTLFIVLFTIFNIWMFKLSGQEDMVVGTPVAGRRHADLEKIVGMFINVLPLRSFPSGGKTFDQFLQEEKQRVLEAFENQGFLFENLVEKVSLKKDLSRNPLFDMMFAFEDTKTETLNRDLPELHMLSYGYKTNVSRFDLTLQGVKSGQGITFLLEYCRDLYKPDTIQRDLQYFKNLVASLLEEPGKNIYDMEIMSQGEKQKLLFDFNETGTKEIQGKTILDLFQENLEINPLKTAIISNHFHITWHQLDIESIQMGIQLRAEGIEENNLVAVMVDRSPRLIVGLLAILKAGGAYLPLDSRYPQKRVKYILDDGGVRVLLTQEKYVARIKELEYEGKIWDIYQKDLTGTPVEPGLPSCNQLENHTKPHHLAYVIYTSGSTGKPKGVLVEHRHVVRFLKGANYIEFLEDDRLLVIGSLAFDISTFEIWGPMLNGITLHLQEDEVLLRAEKIKEVIEKEGITILHLIPQLFNQFASEEPGIFASLRCLMVGGDLLKPRNLNEIRTQFKELNILHMYGPTEGTTFTTYLPVEKNYTRRIPIGKPVSNSSVHILDAYGKLSPIGVPGELYVGKDGVARGYLNKPELTDDKFIPHTLIQGNRTYRTGDLARWLPDGNIEFLGRIDFQVKLRGFRIELGEIENVLHQHNAVEESVVKNWEQEEDSLLVAYYKKKNKIELWPSLAEYFVYDELIYHSLSTDELRNSKYRNAIRKKVKDKVVLEVGPGSTAILSRICIEEGAKKVYAVEIMEEACKNARETIKKLGLEEQILVIQGDVEKVELPEKADCCVSEIVGTIGGSEGAARIMNSIKRLLKGNSPIIPARSITHMAAITLPDTEFDYSFEEVGALYVEKIFQQRGNPFDLRLSLLNFSKKHIISNTEVFELLDFRKTNPLEETHQVNLTIENSTSLKGFILWLNLYCDEEEVIETLENRYIWLPIYFPVFSEGIPVRKNDGIKATVNRKLSENQVNPDYTVTGTVIRQGADPINFTYESPHTITGYRANKFYQTLFSGEKLNISPRLTSLELSTYLAKELPEYMIPSYFVQLEEFPLTSTGKIDRNQLPAPEKNNSLDTYEPASGELEEKLVNIWSEVLNIAPQKISVGANFFEMGGHSLKATLLVSRIHHQLKLKLPIAEVFQAPNIRKMAKYLSQAKKKKFITIEPVEQKEYYALSAAQKRLYIMWKMDTKSTVYNLPFPLLMEGELDIHRLKQSFVTLMQRHDSFRTLFEIIEGDPVQRVKAEVQFEVEYKEIPEQESRNRVKAFIAPFNLEEAPLFRVGVFKMPGHRYVLVLDMHHIISDGTSMGIFTREVVQFYNGQEPEPMKLQYRDFSEWQKTNHDERSMEEQQKYWLEQYRNIVPDLNLLMDYPRPKLQSFDGDIVGFYIEKKETEALKKLGSQEEATLYMTFLALFNVFLSRIGGQEDVVIGTPIAGRRHADLEKIIGMFINTLALRNYPQKDKSFREFLREVRNRSLDAFENQEYQFEELVDKVAFKRTSSWNTLFDVMYEFQNLEIPEVDVQELKIRPFGVETTTSKIDLILHALETGDGIHCSFEYSTALFKEATIKRFTTYFQDILQSILQDTDILLGNIHIDHQVKDTELEVSQEDLEDFTF